MSGFRACPCEAQARHPLGGSARAGCGGGGAVAWRWCGGRW